MHVPREGQPCELLFEFHVGATHTFWHVSRAITASTALKRNVSIPYVQIVRTFHRAMDPTRTPRAMAVGWAGEERKAIELDDEYPIRDVLVVVPATRAADSDR